MENQTKVRGRNGRTAGLNESVFDNWTQANAWALGFLTADGSFPGNCRPHEFVGYNTDIELLLAVRNVFGSEKSISTTQGIAGRKGKKPVGRLALSSPKVCGFFKKIGAYGNKDERNPFSSIPQEFRWAFIKGLFDGDGNVYRKMMSIAGRDRLIGEVYDWICARLQINRNKLYTSSASTRTVYFLLSERAARMAFQEIEQNAVGTYDSAKFLKWKGCYSE